MQLTNNVFKFFVFIIIFSLGHVCIAGQEKFSDLKDKRITTRMENAPFGDIIDFLINNYDVAIGFEESILDRDHNDYDFDTNLPFTRNKKLISSDGNTQISVTTKRIYKVEKNRFTIYAVNERLEDVLNKIIKQMKFYNWEINDGVVNIFPSQGRDVKFENFLKTNVKRFVMKENDRIGFIRTSILFLPEFKSFLSKNELNIISYRSGLLDGLDRGLPAKLDFSNITFKELLNRATKVKRGGWILKQSDKLREKDKEFIEIDI